MGACQMADRVSDRMEIEMSHSGDVTGCLMTSVERMGHAGKCGVEFERQLWSDWRTGHYLLPTGLRWTVGFNDRTWSRLLADEWLLGHLSLEQFHYKWVLKITF